MHISQKITLAHSRPAEVGRQIPLVLVAQAQPSVVQFFLFCFGGFCFVAPHQSQHRVSVSTSEHSMQSTSYTVLTHSTNEMVCIAAGDEALQPRCLGHMIQQLPWS